jgi:hypothetical protein
MIKSRNVERALHSWPPWCKAVDEGRQQTQVIGGNSKRLWSYAGKVLKSLPLPPNPLLRLYFLACTFSEYTYEGNYVFSEIKVPPFLCQGLPKLKVFPASLRCLLNWPELKVSPPEIWSQQDIKFYRDSIGSKTIFYDRNIILSSRHPLRKIGSKMKRSIDTDKTIFCARMKDAGATSKEINDKFGWKPQKDNYGQKRRYPTAYRYVVLGKKLLKAIEAKSTSSSVG